MDMKVNCPSVSVDCTRGLVFHRNLLARWLKSLRLPVPVERLTDLERSGGTDCPPRYRHPHRRAVAHLPVLLIGPHPADQGRPLAKGAKQQERLQR